MRFDEFNPRAFGSFLSSIEGGVFLFGKLCLISATVLGWSIAKNVRSFQSQTLPTFSNQEASAEIAPETKQTFESYSIITSRNIFGTKAKPTANSSNAQNQAQSAALAKLRLVGTSVTKGGVPFAIIEDTGKSEQDVFDLNEKVFGSATLVEVLADSVKIEYAGKVETLMISTDDSGSSGGSSGVSASSDGTEFSVPETELNEALANLPMLLSQARAVPYFRNGVSVGMRLFAIRVGSLYEKLGLKNGDILKAINGNSLADPTQALKIFEQLKTERNINVKVERNGADTDLRYSID
jgi:general secretion pathway protein C